MRGRVIGFALLIAVLSGCGALGVGGDQVTITVRNDVDREVTLEIVESSFEAGGQPARIAPPILIGAGEEGPVTFQSPSSTWSLRVAGVEGFFDSQDLHEWASQLETGEISAFRLVIGESGDMVAETTK